MSEAYEKFRKDIEHKSFDLNHRKTIKFNISRYDEAVARGKKQWADLELAKRRAANIKHKAISRLDDYLIEFEANFVRRGGKVIWAENTEVALREILAVLKKFDARKVVKQKSMVTEEIELNHFLQQHDIEVNETDLGEFIVQVADDKPYHIVTPVMHKSKEDISELFHKKFKLPSGSTPEQITAFVRNYLRDKFVKADAGITGCNFLIADVGAVGLTENEGNGLLSISMPKLHIVISGIEKVIPSINNLDLFLPLLATHGTGQNITVYNNIVFGPRQDCEADGPDDMYVILLDNRRTEVMKHPKIREALQCIRCGACLNGCPIYRNIGGHSYGAVYSGPIGSVISPHLKGLDNYNHLSFASSLCGKCTEVCPVKINLHELLLFNRNEAVKKGYAKFSDRFVMFAWKKVMTNRWMIDFFGAKAKNFLLSKFFKPAWGRRRDLPSVSPKSFRQLWNEHRS
jgi:L-lactate dehydrogenase complex protein LldF